MEAVGKSQYTPKRSSLGSLATRVNLDFTFRFRTFLHTNITIIIHKLVARTDSILGKVYPSIGQEVPDLRLPWQMRPSDDIVVEGQAASQEPSLGVNHRASASRDWVAGNGVLRSYNICLKIGGPQNLYIYMIYIIYIFICIFVYVFKHI